MRVYAGSSLKTSKMPKVVDASWIANHETTLGSASTSGNADLKNAATLCSLPMFAPASPKFHHCALGKHGSRTSACTFLTYFAPRIDPWRLRFGARPETAKS